VGLLSKGEEGKKRGGGRIKNITLKIQTHSQKKRNCAKNEKNRFF
jgi:hypothetical protein